VSLWSDLEDEMHVLPIDADTADRLLGGAVAPEDAPPGYAPVATLLESAAGPPTPGELAREAEVVALATAAVHARSSSSSAPRRFSMPVALTRPRLTAAFVAAGLACSAGLASAGALPGAAQDIASTMLAKVGVSVPGPNENAGTHPSVRGSTPEQSVTTTAGKGAEISELATTTELTGVDKGAEISTAASGGKSQAGQHGAGAGAAVATPGSGGTSTADTASGGASAGGTATADEASGGHSTAGSGNAERGQETADTASGGASSAGQGHKP
jgi:hypothetical protein